MADMLGDPDLWFCSLRKDNENIHRSIHSIQLLPRHYRCDDAERFYEHYYTDRRHQNHHLN